MSLTPKTSLPVLKRNFSDLHPPLSKGEAAVAAARCLFCFDAPCTRACPTHIDIPRFIRQISHDHTLGAARTILGANIFGGSCARVCPTEVLCEGACVDNTRLKAPIEIGRLQRYACDTAHVPSMDFYKPGPSTGRRAAVVGAGPAGLTCAHELRKLGHDVEVFEASDKAGGLNTVGIAAYKISTQFALSEVTRIKRIGVKVHLRRPIDARRLAKLLADYDAVFLAIGLGKTAPLGIPGEKLKGVWESLDFIFQTHTKALDKCKVGLSVVVIGGGNTALDAANAAVRLGAPSVTVVYRRDPASMPAFEHEYKTALESGVRFVWRAQPLRIVGKAGRATGLKCARTRPAPRSSKATIEPIRGSDFTITADMIIKALGQEPLQSFLRAIPGLALNSRGRIVVDRVTRATSVNGLFAGGDCCAESGEEVVNAVQDGKLAAAGIQAWFRQSDERSRMNETTLPNRSRGRHRHE